MKKNKLNAQEVAIQMAEDFKTIKFETENFGFDVSAYTDAKERSNELIVAMIEKDPLLGEISVATGNKAGVTAELNVLKSNVNYSNADCVTVATGDSTVIEPRSVKVYRLTDREELCLDNLDAKLPQLQRAGARNTDLTFSQLYIDEKLAKGSKENIKMAFQGDRSIVGNTNLNKVDGWLKLAKSESAKLAFYDTAAVINASTVLGLISDLTVNRSQMQLDNSNELVIFVNNATFDMISAALIAEYGINPTGVFGDTGYQNQAGNRKMKDPSTGIIIEATSGLDGKGGLFMTTKENLVLATDLEHDKEDVDLYYSKDKKAMIYDLVWTAGFTYYFPELVSYIEYVPASI